MEENKLIVEDLICRLIQTGEQEDYKSAVALKNLIKAYKELEETNEILNQAYWNYCIPVSLVEEKIEELDKMIEKINKGELQKYTVSEILSFKRIYEELLEKRK